MADLQWIVSQIGAREHYAVPRALEQQGSLCRLYTDAWCRRGASLLRRGPVPLRALAARRHADLPPDKVVAFTFAALRAQRRSAPPTVEAAHLEYLRVGRDFAERVNRHLQQQPPNPATTAFFGYNTGCLETLQSLGERGLLTVVDQIDPARVEEEIVREEAKRWPDWETLPGRVPEVYWERLAAEWHAATFVVVNSAWSQAALVRQGVPKSKIAVVPLAYEPSAGVVAARERLAGPLTVLWLGSVTLRKGIPYLIEAAKALPTVAFIVAGPIHIAPEAVNSAPPNVKFVGRVTRDQAAGFYRQADVFVLPTLSDGFAITQLEAMAHGLPVVATPHCGEVISAGEDGLIVPAGDSAALAAAIAQLDGDRRLLNEMSRQALLTARRFSLRHYAQNLEAAVEARR